MSSFNYTYTFVNGGPLTDGDQVDQNFTDLKTYTTGSLLQRDGSVHMTGSLVVPVVQSLVVNNAHTVSRQTVYDREARTRQISPALTINLAGGSSTVFWSASVQAPPIAGVLEVAVLGYVYQYAGAVGGVADLSLRQDGFTVARALAKPPINGSSANCAFRYSSVYAANATYTFDGYITCFNPGVFHQWNVDPTANGAWVTFTPNEYFL